ncbi:MAG: hypothetical protein ACJA0F_002513 [Dinoroseobacter sp.]|jgi:hypothetical protein
MPDTPHRAKPFNVLAVIQGGRLEFEACLFAASFHEANPGFEGRLIFAEPQPGPLWQGDPRVRHDEVRELIDEHGGEIIPFDSQHFGSDYPHGNKIEALRVLPEGEPFVFFDTDTLHLGPLADVPFDFARPSASMMRTATWPQVPLYGPGYTAIWKALYDKFGLEFESSLDPSFPDEYWERYLYFNAGWFFGDDPAKFGELFARFATGIRDEMPSELDSQSLNPWLDQVALPLVIHALGGGRPEFDGLLDGKTTNHWRVLPLLYACAPDEVIKTLERIAAPNRIKKVLKLHDPFKRGIYQGRGLRARALFDRENMPVREQQIRHIIRKNNLWVR